MPVENYIKHVKDQESAEFSTLCLSEPMAALFKSVSGQNRTSLLWDQGPSSPGVCSFKMFRAKSPAQIRQYNFIVALIQLCQSLSILPLNS